MLLAIREASPSKIPTKKCKAEIKLDPLHNLKTKNCFNAKIYVTKNERRKAQEQQQRIKKRKKKKI